MRIFIFFTLIITGVPLIVSIFIDKSDLKLVFLFQKYNINNFNSVCIKQLCSDYIPQLTRNEPNQLQNGTVPIISQVSEDLTLNERMLKLETKSQKQENQISSLTTTVQEDKKEINYLKRRLEQIERKYELDSSEDEFNGGKTKHRREAASGSSRPK